MSRPGPSTPKSRYLGDIDASQWKNAHSALNGDEDMRQKGDAPPPFQTPHTATIFKSNTIAPSPPQSSTPTNESSNLVLNTSHRIIKATDSLDGYSSPQSAGLRIQTDVSTPSYTVTPSINNNTARSSCEPTPIPAVTRTPSLPIAPLARTPSIKNVFASSIGSSSNAGSRPGSAISSPMLSAMADVTPLPSPLMSGDSPGPWKKFVNRPPSRDLMMPITADSALVTANGESIHSAIANQSKRRAYQGLVMSSTETGLNNAQASKEKDVAGHQRNRSISEYVPDAVQVSKSRQIIVSGSHAVMDNTPDSSLSGDVLMRREPHLAAQRGLAPTKGPPTPPSSRTGGEGSDSDSSLSTPKLLPEEMGVKGQLFVAVTRDGSKRTWRGLKKLGEGTFSRVILATSQLTEDEEKDSVYGQHMDGIETPVQDSHFDDKRKKLVAIKLCESGPKGGGDASRIEMSLKRELDIMKSIHHPSLVHLKAWNVEETRASLVLSYCPGGDLFEVASQHRHLLVPSLLRRMFAELTDAVKYLHDRHIVHRDIKLENVLVQLPQHELARPIDWQKYPYSIVTLTDLGLSRRVADDEKLTTRCGSDDYVAPEVLMGADYDGRQVDAWTLGVLLYALLENRLPFDPTADMPQAKKTRSAIGHRIARVDWKWVEFAGEEGDHEADVEKFRAAGLEGAMIVTENLLKRSRSRWPLEKVMEQQWVKGGIDVEGGIQFREEDVPDEMRARIDTSP
ncbi:Pheromone response regulator 1 [Hyphodiscus hymeniophilus]|uniref:Pheromone response regulator 1 n=1 Tax=Hyphodiscus hymeniophilus TaxID=353542 RepID=A0A9P6VGQ1_9HELO|nr:Pheromone response regulator 1 [Hyphodiscus hymeniophilus]